MWLLYFLARKMGLYQSYECGVVTGEMCLKAPGALAVISAVLVVGIFIGYHAFFESRHGATPVKAKLGLLVAGADHTSAPQLESIDNKAEVTPDDAEAPKDASSAIEGVNISKQAWVDSTSVDRISPALSLLRAAIRQLPLIVLVFTVQGSPFALSMAPIAGIVAPSIAMAGLLFGAVREDQMALHDLVTKTRVLKTRPLS